jgi:hypothetical protein
MVSWFKSNKGIEDTRADWYARGVPGAAVRGINKIPAARRLIEESMFRAADIRTVFTQNVAV